VQEAIKNHQVLVGMDRDMVIYAKGRPPRKIRDKDDKGVDYEEWIYGNPPQEVDFVRFQGVFVSRLEIMTVDGQKIVRTQKEVDLQSQENELAAKKPEQKPADAPRCFVRASRRRVRRIHAAHRRRLSVARQHDSNRSSWRSVASLAVGWPVGNACCTQFVALNPTPLHWESEDRTRSDQHRCWGLLRQFRKDH